jgi:hypothetical protein
MIAARVLARHSTRMHRRQFITTSAAAVASAPLLQAEALVKKRRNPFCVFTKPFQSLSYDDLADLIAELGFDGIEGTIRPGGHITPEQVPDELPKMVEALRKRKLELTIMASGINNADDKLNVQQLRVAAKLGVKRYRMGYYKYDLKRPVGDSGDLPKPFRQQLRGRADVGFARAVQGARSRPRFGGVRSQSRQGRSHALVAVECESPAPAYRCVVCEEF